MKGNYDRNGKEELKQRLQRILLSSLLCMSCLVCTLIQTTTTCQAVALPTVGWAFPYKFKTVSCRLFAYRTLFLFFLSKLFYFFISVFIYISNVILFPGFLPISSLSPPVLFYKSVPLPNQPLAVHPHRRQSSILGVQPWQDQGLVLPLIPIMAFLCYICSWRHESVHV